MMKRRKVIKARKKLPNPRLVKVHRSYTVEEVAALFGVHKNSVRNWIKNGLPICDERRPMLVLGRDLETFLKEQRARRKQQCRIGELYCVCCRAPRRPEEDLVQFMSITEKVGNLAGICPDCGTIINRRVSIGRLGEVIGKLEITTTEEERHIIERALPSLNCDFSKKD